jgi:hypothetical protein
MPLNIAPSILEHLGPGVLAMAVGDLEYTDFSCSGCRGDIAAGSAEKLELVQHGNDLRLRPPDGKRADEFSGAMRELPLGWLDAVRRSKRVLVVYGSGFGLERMDLARIDRVMQNGAAVAGLVKWSGAPPSPRRKRK